MMATGMTRHEFLNTLYPPKQAWGREYGRVTHVPSGAFLVFNNDELVRCEGYIRGASERLMQAVRVLLP
jgi:hypothetical protein